MANPFLDIDDDNPFLEVGKFNPFEDLLDKAARSSPFGLAGTLEPQEAAKVGVQVAQAPLGGAPQNVIENPMSTAMSGFPGVQFKAGARSGIDLINAYSGLMDQFGVGDGTRFNNAFEKENDLSPILDPQTGQGKLASFVGSTAAVGGPLADPSRAALIMAKVANKLTPFKKISGALDFSKGTPQRYGISISKNAKPGKDPSIFDKKIIGERDFRGGGTVAKAERALGEKGKIETGYGKFQEGGKGLLGKIFGRKKKAEGLVSAKKDLNQKNLEKLKFESKTKTGKAIKQKFANENKAYGNRLDEIGENMKITNNDMNEILQNTMDDLGIGFKQAVPRSRSEQVIVDVAEEFFNISKRGKQIPIREFKKIIKSVRDRVPITDHAATSFNYHYGKFLEKSVGGKELKSLNNAYRKVYEVSKKSKPLTQGSFMNRLAKGKVSQGELRQVRSAEKQLGIDFLKKGFKQGKKASRTEGAGKRLLSSIEKKKNATISGKVAAGQAVTKQLKDADKIRKVAGVLGGIGLAYPLLSSLGKPIVNIFSGDEE